MKFKVCILFAAACLFLSGLATAQVANDDCTTAQPLGVLGTPTACPSGLGAVSTFNGLTNVNAIEEGTWATTTTCQPNNNSSVTPTADVWYTFVASGNAVNIAINGGIQTPSISLFSSAPPPANLCTYVSLGCALGANGSLSTTVEQLQAGQTYYLQVSGATIADQGTFTMTLQATNSCLDCLLASNLIVNPLPTQGGYQSGTTVTFCFSITDWAQQNINWLHGVVPTFGSGWDMTTLTNLVAANDCDGGGGTWAWYNNIPTNPANGYGNLTGFFFDGNPGPDGQIANNFGDNCGTGDPNGVPSQGAANWTFCWTITAKNCPPGQNGADLGVSIDTYGDGETGNWTSVACTNDPVYQFNAALICCTPPVMNQVNLLCFGASTGTATATAQGVGPFDYVWTNAANATIQTANNQPGANTVSNLAAGTYTVTVTDQDNSCVTTGTVTITQPTQLQLLIASTAETCGQANGSATVTPQGGIGPYDFVWKDATNVTIQTANNQPGANTASNLVGGTYNITVTDANNCVATVAAIVQSSPGNLAFVPASTPVSCAALCDGTATLTLNGGTSPYNYVWKDANNVTVHTDNNIAGASTAPNLCIGTYTISYTDANNCSGSTTITITGPPAVTAAVNPVAICYGQNTNLTATPGGGSGAGYTYVWTPAGTGNTQTVNVAPTVTTVYTVVVSDGNNCPSLPANVTVTVSPQLSVVLAAQPPAICIGENTTLAAIAGGGNGGPYTYTWAPAGTAGNTNTAIVSPATATNYTITVSDGCTIPDATANVNVTVNQLPVVSFIANPLTGCAPLGTVFNNTTANSSSCLWDFGNGTTSTSCGPNVAALYPDPGCYDVTLSVTDANGCNSTLTQPNYICVSYNVVAQFSASPQPTDIFDPEITFTDESNGNPNSWAWTFDSLGGSNLQDPVFRFPAVGDCYNVTLIANNADNCPDTTSLQVCINPNYVIYFPNAFTPNNDGVNNGFIGKGEGIDLYQMWIFDRWGNMIYYTADINQPWDGRMGRANETCQDDVYVWKAHVVDIFGKGHDFIGSVTLLR